MMLVYLSIHSLLFTLAKPTYVIIHTVTNVIIAIGYYVIMYRWSYGVTLWEISTLGKKILNSDVTLASYQLSLLHRRLPLPIC